MEANGWGDSLKSDRSMPPYDLSSFPFGNREFAHQRWAAENRDYWFADAGAIESLVPCIGELEAMLKPEAIGIDALPDLVTDLTKCRSMDVAPSDVFPDDVTYLMLSPLTPTGRKPKFPVVIHFDAYERVQVSAGELGGVSWSSWTGLDGSGGTLSFLPDGSVGKASIGYSHGGVCYDVSWKLARGRVEVSSIRYSDKSKDVFDLKLYPA